MTYYPLTASVTSKQILQGIASGLLGAQAFQGGNATAGLGLGLHYLIAFIWTVVFYVLASNIKVLTRRPQIIGPLYGTFVWLVMNLVVLPLSSVAHRPLRLQPSIIGAVILMIWIGLPMVAIIGRYLRRQRPLPRRAAESGGLLRPWQVAEATVNFQRSVPQSSNPFEA